MQDEAAETQEKLAFVVRSGTDGAGPTVGIAGLLGSVQGLTTPAGGREVKAYVVTTILANPIRLLNSTSHFSFGIALEAAPRWPLDGLSTHMSSVFEQSSHARQEDHAWQIVGAASAATHPTLLRSWRYEAFTYVGTMRLGCGGRFGMGGMFPRTSTLAQPLDMVAFFRSGVPCAGGTPMVALSLIRTNGVPFGQTGSLYLGGRPLVLIGTPTNASGSGLLRIAPMIPTPLAGAGTVHAQGAIVLPNGALKLTNAQSITL